MRYAAALAALLLLLASPPSRAAEHRYFVTSDGVRLHYIEAGKGQTMVLVPGWTMPAWIWQRQIDHFARQYRVIAFDPRGQGDSAIPESGYDHRRRGQDIADLIAALGPAPVLLVGWSLGVLDSLAYVHEHGDARLAGLVLVDNSIGEDPPPPPPAQPMKPGPKLPREVMMRNFVRGMFARPQPATWLDRLTETCLRTPQPVAAALLAYPVPRTYWKEAVYATTRPVFYIVRPKFEGQAANLAARHKTSETVVVRDAGHALFVDKFDQFNELLGGFIKRRVWH
ncbi:MAG: alpha/beta hydrolase [Alphaproteobacteria bacterium]|nr:alpha/beta hydrolase [Alphaproteobacteria bacterium]